MKPNMSTVWRWYGGENGVILSGGGVGVWWWRWWWYTKVDGR